MNRDDYQYAEIRNGKPSWKNDVAAIWMDPSNGNWNIGKLNDFGSNNAALYAHDEGGITANKNQWYFSGKNGWTAPSDPNDIIVTCVSGKQNLTFNVQNPLNIFDSFSQLRMIF